MEIHIDDREKYVITHIEQVNNTNVKYKVCRMTVGDYAIMYNGSILVLIERKTWKDLAASLHDGRKNNVRKLISVRDRTNCKLVYLIEGTPCPKLSKKYNRISVKNLQARLDHLLIRDNISSIHTINQQQTAIRLFEMANNIITIKPSILIASNDEYMLTEKQMSVISIQEQLLKCIRSVGANIATIMAEHNITIQKFETLNPNELARYKLAGGHAIGLTRARKICDNKRHFTSCSKVSRKIQINILSKVPLISKDTARRILSDIKFIDLLHNKISLKKLANVKRNKSRLGPKAASNIINYLQGIEPGASIENDEKSNKVAAKYSNIIKQYNYELLNSGAEDDSDDSDSGNEDDSDNSGNEDDSDNSGNEDDSDYGNAVFDWDISD